MKLDTMLEIQAAADGELSGPQSLEVAGLLSQDAGARALAAELNGMRELLRRHETTLVVPDSREFYWSQVQRRMRQSVAPHPTSNHGLPSLMIWRWLAPMMGVSALVAVVALTPFFSAQSSSQNPVAGRNQATTVTFSSEADGVTIHWIN